MVNTGKAVGNAAKIAGKIGMTIATEGFKAIDQGAEAFSNSTIGNKLVKNAEAEYAHMRRLEKERDALSSLAVISTTNVA